MTVLFVDLVSSFLVQSPPPKPYQLECDRDIMKIGLDVNELINSGFNPFSGNLANRNCTSARVLDGVVWYEVEASEGACGNILRVRTCLQSAHTVQKICKTLASLPIVPSVYSSLSK